MVEVCTKCHRAIAASETAYVVDQEVVCEKCYEVSKRQSTPDRRVADTAKVERRIEQITEEIDRLKALARPRKPGMCAECRRTISLSETSFLHHERVLCERCYWKVTTPGMAADAAQIQSQQAIVGTEVEPPRAGALGKVIAMAIVVALIIAMIGACGAALLGAYYFGNHYGFDFGRFYRELPPWMHRTVWTIMIVICLFSGYVVLLRMAQVGTDEERIRKHFQARGCRVTETKVQEGKPYLAEMTARQYEIRYIDSAGYTHVAHCETGEGCAVKLSNDVILKS